MVEVDRSTGLVTADDGSTMEFRGPRIIFRSGSDEVQVNYERLGDGTRMVLYDDLVIRGVDTALAKKAIETIRDAMEQIGMGVEVE